MAELTGIGIEAIGYSLGENLQTNDNLQNENPRWDMSRTLERTGVSSRTIAASGTTALDLAYRAAVDVLNETGLKVSDIDALIFCTQTSDHILPPNSALLHGMLNMPKSVMAFDINHACSGFMYSLGIARSLVASRTASRVLVLTADTYSRLVHPEDRSIRPLFGDGGAATVVSAYQPRLNIIDMSFETSGKHSARFMIKNGGARSPKATSNEKAELDGSGRISSPDHIKMDGIGVLSFFNDAVPTSVRRLLATHGKTIDDISQFFFHQASQLALDGLAKALGIPANKMVVDMSQTGNLVSASIPVVLAKFMKTGAPQPGDQVVICGFGVGFSWSTALAQF